MMSAESTTSVAAVSSPRTRWNSFEVWLGVLAVVSALNGLAEKSPSVAFFGLVTAAVALTAKLGQSPLQLTQYVRNLFYHSARLARALLIVIAVGGTFLVFDVTFKGFDPLPEWCDVWVKRAAPGLIALTIIAIWGYQISHRIHKLSPVDSVVGRYELPVYFALILLASSFLLLMLGNPIENTLTTAHAEPATAAVWTSSAARLLRIAIGISFVWSVAFSAILFTRLHERQWKAADLLDGTTGSV